jgi:hypothetical protein
VQSKIGQYVDTFMASQLLSELKSKSGDEAFERRVGNALDKVLAKIEKNQRTNGTWDGSGWAPSLSQAMASKGLNRAAQAGAIVNREVIDKTEDYAEKQFDGSKVGAEGSAGVELYNAAASAGAMRDSRSTKETEIKKDRELAEKSKDVAERAAAKKRVESYDRTVQRQAAVEQGLVSKLEDSRFVSGFGSNGGEEFLSYMLVAESLVVKGGEEWTKWDQKMTANLIRVQNNDGSWSGHHCITGKTFVTSAALLVLTADRAPVPLAAQLKKG